MIDLFNEFSPDELLRTDVKLIGLKKKAWNFSRGSRTYREYHYDNDTVAVKDVYTYVMKNGDRDVQEVHRCLEWYDDQGVKQLEKDISPDLNIKNLKSLNRDIRHGRMDYMIAAAEELVNLAPYVPEPYSSDFAKATDSINVILKHYEKEILSYIENGDMQFEDAVRNEANPIMIDILSLGVRPPDALFPSGLTIKQTILHQLTGEYNP